MLTNAIVWKSDCNDILGVAVYDYSKYDISNVFMEFTKYINCFEECDIITTEEVIYSSEEIKSTILEYIDNNLIENMYASSTDNEYSLIIICNRIKKLI